MKKYCILLFLLLPGALLRAETGISGSEPPSAESYETAYEDETEAEAPPKKKFRFKNRMLEFVVDVSGGATNDMVAARDFLFRETAVVNIDDFLTGIKVDAAANLFLVPFNFNWKDKWGFSFPMISAAAAGNVEITKNVINLKQVNREQFGPGGAVFVDVSVPFFFHAGDAKITIRPSAFLPLVYTSPGMYYTHKTVTAPGGNSGTRIQVDFEQKFYMGMPGEYVERLKKIVDGDMTFDLDFFNSDSSWSDILWETMGYVGYDLGIGIEYPLDNQLTAGVDITCLPIYRPRLDRYIQMTGSAYFDSSLIDLNEVIAGNMDMSTAYAADYQFSTGKGSTEKIWRPFKMVLFADYRPFDSPVLSLIPQAGFALNPLHVSLASFEGGIKIRSDLANIFISGIGVGYYDRMWKNSLDITLNLRVFQIDLGVIFQSQDFVKSWQGAGAGVNVRCSFGW